MTHQAGSLFVVVVGHSWGYSLGASFGCRVVHHFACFATQFHWHTRSATPAAFAKHELPS